MHKAAFEDNRFVGTADQLRALVAVSAIQPLFTTQRARPKPEPGDRVYWPEGECAYEDAARFSQARLDSLRLTAYAVAAHTYHKLPKDPMDPDVQHRLGAMLRYMRPSLWKLPEVGYPLRKGFWHRQRKDPVEDLTHRLYEEDVIGTFFKKDTQGYLDPVQAAAGLEPVTIHTRHGVLPWSQVGHVGERRLSAFTLQMADAILACAQYDRDPEEREKNLPNLSRAADIR